MTNFSSKEVQYQGFIVGIHYHWAYSAHTMATAIVKNYFTSQSSANSTASCYISHSESAKTIKSTRSNSTSQFTSPVNKDRSNHTAITIITTTITTITTTTITIANATHIYSFFVHVSATSSITRKAMTANS